MSKRGLSKMAPVAALLAIALAWNGCSHTPSRHTGWAPTTGRLITYEEIQKLHVGSAWDVLVSSGIPMARYDNHIAFRGRVPLVIVDGIHADGVMILRDITVQDLSSVRLLSGIEASTRYGGHARGGAIIIETMPGRRRR